MKRRAFSTVLFFVITFLFEFNLLAQTFDKTYQIHCGILQESIPMDDGTIISATESYGFLFITKTDRRGNLIWHKIFHYTSENDDYGYFNLLTKTNDGGFATIQRSYPDNSSSVLHLIKFSSDGDSLWTKTFELNDHKYYASSIIQTTSGEFILLGETITRFVIIKTDAEGNLIWDKYIHSSQIHGNYLSNLVELNDSSFLVRRDYGLFAYTMDGDSLWEKETDFQSSFASKTADGNVIISGRNKLLKISTSGEDLWSKNFDEKITYVKGMADLTSTLIIDYRKIVSVTNYGATLWEEEIAPEDDYNYIFSVNETNDHYILASGKYHGNWYLPRLIKMDPEGNFKTFDLEFNYPTNYQTNSYDYLFFNWRTSECSSINIEYSTNGGDSWLVIEENYPADSLHYSWLVPNTPTEDCFVKIIDSSDPEYFEQSFHPFSIIDYIEYDYIAANEILMWAANDGDGSHNPRTDGSGLCWPGGENAAISVTYEDGLVFGGKYNGEIRVNGNTYRQGLYPGPIFSDGTLPDEKDPRFKLFKLKKDWEQMPDGTERNKYENNYENWPMEYGAPFEDVNNDGEYTPGIDTPEILGDETLFYVANGSDSSRSAFTYGSPPMPLEFQTTVWAYDDEGMENVVFKKYRVINKGETPIEDFYFTYWTDVDLGFAEDDLSGCDTLLSLGYTYNGDNDDDSFYGPNPPAIGYQLVQGPIVEGDESDSAYFNGSWRKGFKNLPMTNFFNVVKSDPAYGDVPLGIYDGSLMFYNNFQTLIWNGEDILDPYNNNKVSYMTPGDPVAGEGWYDGEGWPLYGSYVHPRDARFFMTAGPFNFEPNDTQEVVYAIHIARGTDNLNSVTKLKEQAIAVQRFYNGKILTSLDDETAAIPEQFELFQNYPNPFSKSIEGNATTTIKYSIPENENIQPRVSLKVYDVLGRVVATLVDENQPPGKYKITFDGTGLASGIYLITLQVNDFRKTIKAVMLK